MLWNGELEVFLDRFMQSQNSNESKLKTSLLSVPAETWPTVWCRLEVALHEEEKYLPPVSNVSAGEPLRAWVPTEEDLRNSDIVEMKKRILDQEMHRRLGQKWSAS